MATPTASPNVNRGAKKTRREPLPLSEMALRHNASLLEYCRTSISALSGASAGILGLTGLYGFFFYFFTAFVMSLHHLNPKSRTWPRSVETHLETGQRGTVLPKGERLTALNVMLLIKAGSDWRKYFRVRIVLFTNGFMSGLFTYILFWTFIYGMVHVY